jgi:hypothetical protein
MPPASVAERQAKTRHGLVSNVKDIHSDPDFFPMWWRTARRSDVRPYRAKSRRRTLIPSLGFEVPRPLSLYEVN